MPSWLAAHDESPPPGRASMPHPSRLSGECRDPRVRLRTPGHRARGCVQGCVQLRKPAAAYGSSAAVISAGCRTMATSDDVRQPGARNLQARGPRFEPGTAHHRAPVCGAVCARLAPDGQRCEARAGCEQGVSNTGSRCRLRTPTPRGLLARCAARAGAAGLSEVRTRSLLLGEQLGVRRRARHLRVVLCGSVRLADRDARLRAGAQARDREIRPPETDRRCGSEPAAAPASIPNRIARPRCISSSASLQHATRRV
jgi:hypothetical protein